MKHTVHSLIKLIFIISTLLVITKSNASCDFKIAKSQYDLYHGNSIFDSGVINDSWKMNASSKFTSNNKIDYFYLTETKQSEHEDKFELKITSEIKDLEVHVILKDEIPEALIEQKLNGLFLLKSFEVTYSCGSFVGDSNITLNITSSDCGEFSIYWKKSCINEISSAHANINVGITSNPSYFVNKGVINTLTDTEFYIPFDSHELELLVSKGDLNDSNTYVFSQPSVTYDESTMEIMLTDPLKIGGILDSSKYNTSLKLVFACKPNQSVMSQVQVKLNIKDSKNISSDISFLLKKQCDTISNSKRYFTFLTIVYIILVLFVILVILIFLLPIINENNYQIKETFNAVYTRINVFFKEMYLNLNSKYYELMSSNQSSSEEIENDNRKFNINYSNINTEQFNNEENNDNKSVDNALLINQNSQNNNSKNMYGGI